MTDFSNRAGQVLGSRKQHTWGAAVGLSKPSVVDFFAGRVPRMETLSRIAHIERVSLTWLSDGVGAPFLVSELAEPSPVLELIEAGADAALLLHDGSGLCIALRTPIQKTYPRRKDAAPVTLSYPEWVVFDVHCAYSAAVAPLLGALTQGSLDVRVAACTAGELESIQQGRVGNWDLFGDFGGVNPLSLWARAVPADVPERLDAMLGQTVHRLTHDTFSTLAIAAEPSGEYSVDIQAIWQRIPKDRQALAVAQLRLLAGERVQL